jgi:hypothetical protein
MRGFWSRGRRGFRGSLAFGRGVLRGRGIRLRFLVRFFLASMAGILGIIIRLLG